MTGSGALADLVASVASGGADASALGPAFCGATVFALAAERPGVLVPSGGPVPVFSSMEQLGRFAGPARWLSTSGEDLLRLLPAGTDLLLDPASDTPLRLDGDAVRRQLTVTAGARA